MNIEGVNIINDNADNVIRQPKPADLFKTNAKPELQLNKVDIVYDVAQKHITVHDKTDQFNLPACYTTKKRSIRKTWSALTAACATNPDISISEVMNIFRDTGSGGHYWCRMD